MAAALRKTGIGLVGDVPWGSHFCHFYETRPDLFDILVPYFQPGLEANEACIWVVTDAAEQAGAREALRGALPDLRLQVRKHRPAERVDAPWLHVAAGRGQRRKFQDFLNRGSRDWLVQECANGSPVPDRIGYAVHGIDLTPTVVPLMCIPDFWTGRTGFSYALFR